MEHYVGLDVSLKLTPSASSIGHRTWRASARLHAPHHARSEGLEHPKVVATEFVPPPMPDADNEIRIVFIDPQGKHVPFEPPPELAAAATGPNAPQQLDVDRSEDRQLLTR